MTRLIHPTVLAFLVTTLHMAPYTALRITITPNSFRWESPSPVNISCWPDTVDYDTEDIYLMEIKKGDDNPMVFLRKGDGISYDRKITNTSQFQTIGHLDTDPTKSYLTLTIKTPLYDDNGTYTCIMYYSDQSGRLKEHRASDNLMAENNAVHNVVKKLLDKVSLLESQLQAQKAKDSEVSDKMAALVENCQEYNTRLSALEEESRNQSQSMTSLDSKVSFTAAFSATADKHTKLSNDDVVIFSNVMMRQGNDYNEKTGVFKASRPGLYAFHLAAMDKTHNSFFQLGIVKNGDTLAIMSVTSGMNWDASSTSTLTNLEKGDQVKVIVVGRSTSPADVELMGSPASVFTGYLIKAY